MGLKLPDEMGDGARIVASTSTGVTTPDGKPVPMSREFANASEAMMGVAGGAAGISDVEMKQGAGLLRLVAGTDVHPEVAALGLDKIPQQTAVESHHSQVTLQHTPNVNGPENGRGGHEVG